VVATHPAFARLLSFKKSGIEVLRMKRNYDFSSLLRILYRRGVCSLMVEAGGVLSAYLLKRHIVDKVSYFIAPKFIGSEGFPAVGPLQRTKIKNALSNRIDSVQKVGDDILLTIYPL
jgi:diaminohydroxyphosphoribosylaminopyrimidine deaminase/5-amino-6-(5-phosphoribosylamino)uracil reductase